jgi:hypothetical protein
MQRRAGKVLVIVHSSLRDMVSATFREWMSLSKEKRQTQDQADALGGEAAAEP